MLPLRISLNDNVRAYLRNLRLDNKIDNKVLTAEELSLLIGKNRAWVSQIESGRLKTIRREDIIFFVNFFNQTDTSNTEKDIELFLNSNNDALKDNALNNDNWDNVDTELIIDDSFNLLLDSLVNSFNRIYVKLSKEEQRIMTNSIYALLENYNTNSTMTNRIIGLPFHYILDCSDNKLKTNFLNNLSNMTKTYITQIIDDQIPIDPNNDSN